MLNKQDAIHIILEYYNEEKQIAREYEQRHSEIDHYSRGELCAIRYILINVYGFKQNDNRF